MLIRLTDDGITPDFKLMKASTTIDTIAYSLIGNAI
jgi:hypothetical protein